MSAERLAAQRQRARLVGRVVLAIVFAPALFFVWGSIGLPSIPGVDFGNGGAQADTGVVVQIAGTPYTQANADPFRDRASAVAAAAHRSASKNVGRASTSQTRAPTPSEPTLPPSRTSDAANPIEPPVPSGTGPAVTAITPPGRGSMLPATLQTLRTVQTPLPPATLPSVEAPSTPTALALPPPVPLLSAPPLANPIAGP